MKEKEKRKNKGGGGNAIGSRCKNCNQRIIQRLVIAFNGYESSTFKATILNQMDTGKDTLRNCRGP